MGRFILVAVAFAGFALEVQPASAADDYFISVYQENQSSGWDFGLIDGKLGFLGKRKGDVGEDESQLPVIPHDDGMMREAFRWLRDGDTLRLDLNNDDLQRQAKNQREKHHWFLTGAYTEHDAQVVLTKEKTKYSHWEFIHVKDDLGADGPRYNIKNINDLSKDAWFGMNSSGVRYKGHREIRKPCLTFGNDRQLISMEREDATSK
ncbi:MAG TPA: hypothetical protein VG056_13570 [Pirellulales bacterium]|jgi:hypothetical protein|nr:hypothetical protein [Pirellulales bacterium]